MLNLTMPYNLPIEDWDKIKPKDRAKKVLSWLESHEGDHWRIGNLDEIQMSVWLLYEEGSTLREVDQLRMVRGIRWRFLTKGGLNASSLEGFTSFF
jgi:hypothetical protein